MPGQPRGMVAVVDNTTVAVVDDVDEARAVTPLSFLQTSSTAKDDVVLEDEQQAGVVMLENSSQNTPGASVPADGAKNRQHSLLHQPGVVEGDTSDADESESEVGAVLPAIERQTESSASVALTENDKGLGAVVEEIPAATSGPQDKNNQPFSGTLELPTVQQSQQEEVPLSGSESPTDAEHPSVQEEQLDMSIAEPPLSHESVGEVLKEPANLTSVPSADTGMDAARPDSTQPVANRPEVFSPEAVRIAAGVADGVLPTVATDASRHGGKRREWKKVLVAIGSGTGFVDEPSWNNLASKLQRELIDRAWYQSNAVLLLVAILYLGALVEGLIVVYKQVKNDSSVTFYADPRVHSSSMDTFELEDFLTSFNTPPKQVFLQVTGYLPVADGFFGWDSLQNVVEWKGSFYHVAFSFSLDLSTWTSRLPSSSPTGGHDQEGFALVDLDTIRAFLTDDSNDLEMLDIRKKVVWPGWEELAQSIKEHIQQQGFGGMVVVKCTDGETMSVFKNRQWANFMHNHATKALAAISLIGLVPYLWYMSRMCRTKTVEVQHQINISTQEFWNFIVEQMSSNGFESAGAPADVAAGGRLSREQRPRPDVAVGGGAALAGAALAGVDWRS